MVSHYSSAIFEFYSRQINQCMRRNPLRYQYWLNNLPVDTYSHWGWLTLVSEESVIVVALEFGVVVVAAVAAVAVKLHVVNLQPMN